MWPAFLLLMGVGPLVAAAVVSPRTVTELMYRGLTLVVMLPVLVGGVWGLVRGPMGSESGVVQGVQAGLVGLTVVLAGLAWGMGSARRLEVARWLGLAAGALGLLAASHLLHDEMVVQGTGLTPGPKWLAMGVQTVACALAMGAVGLPVVVLMATGQGWTRALGRLEPAWLAVCGAVVVQSAVAGVMVGGGVGVGGWVRWAMVVVGLGLAVMAVRARRGGGRVWRWGRKIRVGGALFVLVSWGVWLVGTAWGLVLLRASSFPI